MGMFDFSDPSGGGLMGMFANPQAAGLLGMAGGLLQAAGPSRIPVSMGQAMGAGLQGMGQGVGNAFQTQQQLLRMRAMQGLMGGDMGQPGAQPQSTPSYSSMFGPASTAPATMPQTSGAAPDTSGAPAQTSGASIYGRSPQQLFQQGMLMNMAGIQGGGDMMRIAVEHDPTLAAQMPTDITKMAVQGGMSPEETQAANRGGVLKANYIAPTALRTPIYFDPMTGTTKVVPPEQLAQGYGAQYGAEARAKAGYQLQQVWDPTANGGQGGYVFQTQQQIADAANGAPGAAPTGGLVGMFAQQESNGGRTAPDNPLQIQQGTFNQYAQNGESWSNPADRTAVAQRVINMYGQKYGGDLGRIATAYFSGEGNVAPAGSPTPFIRNVSDSNGKSVASYVGDMYARATGGTPGASQGTHGAPMAAQPPLGQGQFAQGQVQQMQQRWGALRDQNANAQTVISQLQNISSLAPAAITGAEADKRAYVNGLLSLVGIPGAQDAKTATDLLGKYSNQIVAKLGQGGLGTDAARSIVEAGNPNAHMTVPAIQEAVRNLQGQYQMVQAKTNLLQQFANGNNPAAYSKAETVFDQNADPRIWEYQSIQDPMMRQKFAAGVLKQDPKFGQKIQALEKLGAL